MALIPHTSLRRQPVGHVRSWPYTTPIERGVQIAAAKNAKAWYAKSAPDLKLEYRDTGTAAQLVVVENGYLGKLDKLDKPQKKRNSKYSVNRDLHYFFRSAFIACLSMDDPKVAYDKAKAALALYKERLDTTTSAPTPPNQE